MREKGHQNWPLVIALWYDPHLPFSRGSISKPWSKRDMSSSSPLSKGWVFPTVPLQSLPVSQEAPRQRPDSVCWLTQPQKEKCNTYLWDYLESRVSLWKRELCPPRRDETCDTRNWFDAAALAWGGAEFPMLQIWRCRLEPAETVWMVLRINNTLVNFKLG